ncbi:MAG: hypothetical protein RL408_1188 [Bacteroidota bacterium]|jgi:hypothetical protein
MDKHTLIKKLTENHQEFIACVDQLSTEEFSVSRNEKWTAGQQLEHIYLSVKPVGLGFRLPKFLLKLVWGKSNREGRSYDALIERYQARLENGGKASGPFVPKKVDLKKGQKLKENLKKEVLHLCLYIEKISEENLDYYVLPHPLLGKLTLREMLYFTLYHVKHHEKQIRG